MIAEQELKPIPRFNDHGPTCKGHGNWMLDCEFTRQEDRDLMIRIIDNAIASYDRTD